ADVEFAEISETASIQRREERMVKDIIKVCADLQPCTLGKSKVFTQAEVCAPRAGANEKVPFGNRRVIKDVRTGGGEAECSRIEELAVRCALIWVPNDNWTERRSAEISDCINKPTGDIARKNRTAVIRTIPEWGKACTALGE